MDAIQKLPRAYLSGLAALIGLGLVAVLYDAQVTAWLVWQTESHPALEEAARFITDWGNCVFYLGFGLVLVAGLLRGDRALARFALAYFLTLLLFSFVLVRLIKVGVGRPRPWVGAEAACQPFSVEARYNSFPSGHTSDAFAAVAPTFRVTAAEIRHSSLPAGPASLAFLPVAPAWRWLGGRLLKAAVLGLAVLVSLTRIMLGQHYLTDVLMGAALGVGGGLVVTLLLERLMPLETPGRVRTVSARDV